MPATSLNSASISTVQPATAKPAMAKSGKPMKPSEIAAAKRAANLKNKAKEAKLLKSLQRDYVKEARNAMMVTEEMAPRLLALQQKYDPQYAQSEVATAQARSAAETAAVTQSGTSIRNSIMAASPEITAATEQLGTQLRDQGPSDIEKSLQQQAKSELSLGGALSPDELREVSQGSRASFMARGLGYGQTSAVAEVMSRAGASQVRLEDRRRFAAGVDTLTNQRKEADRQFTMNGLNTATNVYDPYLRMFGKGGSQTSGISNTSPQFQNFLPGAQTAGQSNQAVALTLQNQKYQTQENNSQRAAELDNANMNAGYASAISKKNNNAAVGAAGGLAAAYILFALI